MSRPRALQAVVAVGGGNGLPVVLTGLRRWLHADCRITAIVTAADDGGSSGVLREQYDVLPPGDIRNCLIALSRVGPEVSAALQYRFDGGAGPGHPVGNLLLAALDMVTSDELTAIRLAAALLGVRDVILPSTTRRIHLVAELADGRQVRGESKICRGGAAIVRVGVDPPDVAPSPEVVTALQEADAVILGPGSLYTSVLATLAVPGIVQAIVAARGPRIFVCNLMTEPGETDGYGVAAHLRALAAHGLPPESLDYVVVNTGPIPATLRARYATAGAEPVTVDREPSVPGPVVVTGAFVAASCALQHDSNTLGRLLGELATASSRRAPAATVMSGAG